MTQQRDLAEAAIRWGRTAVESAHPSRAETPPFQALVRAGTRH
jgi:hypothetical protein